MWARRFGWSTAVGLCLMAGAYGCGGGSGGSTSVGGNGVGTGGQESAPSSSSGGGSGTTCYDYLAECTAACPGPMGVTCMLGVQQAVEAGCTSEMHAMFACAKANGCNSSMCSTQQAAAEACHMSFCSTHMSLVQCGGTMANPAGVGCCGNTECASNNCDGTTCK